VNRIVVTGAAGFIGSHLVEALLDRGDDVVGVDNFDPFYPRAAKEENLAAAAARPGFRFVELDIRERDRLASLLDAGTVVVHLAARAGVRQSVADPAGYAAVNVGGTAAVLEAMRAAGATRLVFASSSSVYGADTPLPFREDAAAMTPVSPYGATKRAAELLIQALAPLAGLRVASLRLFTVFGPRQRPDLAMHAFARRMIDGEPITLYGEGQSRDYTFVADAVAGIVAAVDWTAGAAAGMVEHLNLGANQPVALDVMVAELARALGVTPRIERAPMQPGDVSRTAADPARAAAVLHYAPRTSFADGIERFVAWCRETYAFAH
jgi:UDP-glucuronate 4-epimerase